MTLYTRGYRPYAGPKVAKTVRFGPIVREGWKAAARTKAFWILFGLGAVVFVMVAVMMYLGTGVARPRGHGPMSLLQPSEEVVAREALWAALKFLQLATAVFGAILTLFVGAGLVADDLKSRALQLYLVRPITPMDYYLGKILIPVRVLGVTLLLPGLALVLLAGLFRPTDRMLPFLAAQGDILGGVLLHFLVAALSFGSLALLASTWAARRIGAMVLAGGILFGGEIPRGMGRHLEGLAGELLRATSLIADAQVVLERTVTSASMGGDYPPLWSAVAVPVAVVLVGALAVLRRARSVEVSA